MRYSTTHIADVDFGAMGSPFGQKAVRQLIVVNLVLGFHRSKNGIVLLPIGKEANVSAWPLKHHALSDFVLYLHYTVNIAALCIS